LWYRRGHGRRPSGGVVAAGRAAPAMIRAKADGGGEPAGPRNRVAVDHVRDLRPIGRQRDPAHRPRAGALQEFLLLERHGPPARRPGRSRSLLPPAAAHRLRSPPTCRTVRPSSDAMNLRIPTSSWHDVVAADHSSPIRYGAPLPSASSPPWRPCDGTSRPAAAGLKWTSPPTATSTWAGCRVRSRRSTCVAILGWRWTVGPRTTRRTTRRPAGRQQDGRYGGGVSDPSRVDQPHRFRIDVTEVVLTSVGADGDHLCIQSWQPGRGRQRRERR